MKNVRKKTPSLLLMITLVGFPQISESIFTPVLPKISTDFQVSAASAQLTMSIYFVAFALGVLIWGQLSDRFGRRPTMLMGIVCYLIGDVGLLLSPTFHILLAMRFIQAFGASVGSVVTQTIMRESFSGLTGAKVFSKVGAAMALSPALGPLIGGIVQTYFGYRSVFGTLVGLAIGVLLYGYERLPETRDMASIQQSALYKIAGRLLKDPIVWAYSLLIGGINGILFGYYAEAPFIFINHFGYTAVQYGSLGLVLAVASLLGAFLVNRLLTYLRPETIALFGLLFSDLAGGLLLISLKFDQAWIMIVGFFLIFLGLNTTLPIALNLALKGYESIIGGASGLFSFGYYLIVSLLTYLVSFWHNGTIWMLPIFMVILCLLMALTYWIVVYKRTSFKNIIK